MMKRYAIALLLAVIIHIVAGAGLVWSFGVKPKDPEMFKIPEHIQAKLVVLDKPKAVKSNQKDRLKTSAKANDAAKKDAEKKRLEAEKKKQEEAKKAADKQAKEKAAADKQAKERAAKEAEEKKQAEEALKAEELRQQEAERQKKEQIDAAKREESLLEGLDEEDTQIEQQVQDEAAAATYYELIKAQIAANWSRPASARNGMIVAMELHLLPNGELQDVFILQSSGDAATDRSAEVAVRKVRKFQVPDDPKIFEKYFRVIQFGFKPEDLMR
ncbi:cell envelope integrity protein TolA [Gynuella sunshinyii]|uniref:Periplasmic protein TonB, links inner and outer membrane n=1 Tax=Gynuella sunshinyii YC6258 TaxID=1445510 RepID=A0A0C5VVX8_9GAMM|nr:cell envelope integrity protein TolA [Gynuella sunshinyii]AJQ94619.1 periplasmic protein TonB, links inner and outer membrane [Gynuella sunshinyii YC6258]